MKRIDEQLRGYHSPLTNSVSADEKHSLATWQEDIAELIMEYTFSEEAVVCEKSFNTFNNICKMIAAQLD